MSATGFYLMHRGWQHHAVFRNEAFSRRDAFVWLIEEAAFDERKVHAPKGIVTLHRGQLCHSTRYMAKAWGWDESKVRRFLASLLDAEIIDAATDAGQYVINLRNYAKYQAGSVESDAASDAEMTQQRRGGDAKKKEGKEGKEESSPTRVTRAHALPADFQPELTEAARATVAKWPPGMLERELDQFKDRAVAKGETYKDWQAAFRTWIRNADKYRGQGNGSYRNGTGAGHGQVNGFRAAIRHAKAVLGPDDDERMP